ncbi:helix-turn-helix domain-containing protein [Peribacillus frigoritolerans]|uniref:helix-turn-helix domain-containing protein n=1 Tax=Peribacillus frigoritolerans TaxID=450367 RepID=UPI0035D8F8B9
MKNNEVFIQTYVSLFRSGLAAKLKPTNLAVLESICSYMNERGECWPTHEQIAKDTGLSTRSVQTAVKFLCEFRIDHKPILSRRMEKHGKFKNTVYKVYPTSQIAIFGGEIEPGNGRPGRHALKRSQNRNICFCRTNNPLNAVKSRRQGLLPFKSLTPVSSSLFRRGSAVH